MLLEICFTASSHYFFAHNSKDINRGKQESLPVSFWYICTTRKRESDILFLLPIHALSSLSLLLNLRHQYPAGATTKLTHTRTLTQRGRWWHSKRRRSKGGDALHLTSPTFPPFFAALERANLGQEEEATEEKASHFVGFWRDFPARDIRSPSSVVGWGN